MAAVVEVVSEAVVAGTVDVEVDDVFEVNSEAVGEVEVEAQKLRRMMKCMLKLKSPLTWQNSVHVTSC